MPSFEITDVQDARLAPYRSLKVNDLRAAGLFIAESLPVVKTLLATSWRIVSCLTTPEIGQRVLAELPAIAEQRIPVYLVPRTQLETLIGFRFHQGIMMAAEMPPRRGILEQVAQWPNPHVIVALNGVHDPQNVGLIIRNCAAFRVAVVIVDGKTHEPFYRKVVRVSMGAVFHQPLAYEPDLVPALRLLKEKYGTRIIVTSHKPPAVPLSQADLSGNICFVLGNEAAGIDPGIAKLAAMTVTIPFASERIESLNVASASAVCLFEAQRVRDCPASR